MLFLTKAEGDLVLADMVEITNGLLVEDYLLSGGQRTVIQQVTQVVTLSTTTIGRVSLTIVITSTTSTRTMAISITPARLIAATERPASVLNRVDIT